MARKPRHKTTSLFLHRKWNISSIQSQLGLRLNKKLFPRQRWYSFEKSVYYFYFQTFAQTTASAFIFTNQNSVYGVLRKQTLACRMTCADEIHWPSGCPNRAPNYVALARVTWLWLGWFKWGFKKYWNAL